MSEDEFLEKLRTIGWVKFEQVLNKNIVDGLNRALDAAYETCRAVQVKNGIGANTDGSVHHLLGQEDFFLEVLQQRILFNYLNAYFGCPFILNSYGGVINLKNKLSYVGNIHRDIRTFFHLPMMMNMLIMLDNFTLENGATYLLSGSHLKDEKPEADFFYSHASRAIGKAGDIVLFDSKMWHAAGENITDSQRRALTLTFTRPFMKQQLDYPRFIGYDRIDEFDDEMQQILGYSSRVPANLDEWYQPPHKRFYKPGQG